jgi:hypothetical protein
MAEKQTIKINSDYALFDYIEKVQLIKGAFDKSDEGI